MLDTTALESWLQVAVLVCRDQDLSCAQSLHDECNKMQQLYS